jgi:hypothetical protein
VSFREGVDALPMVGGETRSRNIDLSDERDERWMIEGNVGEEGNYGTSAGRVGGDEDVGLGRRKG